MTASGDPHPPNEVGSSFTYGLVPQPRWIPGLSMSGDSIEINMSWPYDITKAVTLALNINNITNESPPYPAAGCLIGGSYDDIGRMFLFEARAKF